LYYGTDVRVRWQPLEDTLDMKARVLAVLEGTGMAESRAAKMDQDDFLR
jgi:hypothetical protein